MYLYLQQCAENKEKKNTVLTIPNTYTYIQHDKISDPTHATKLKFLYIAEVKDSPFDT